MKFSQIASSLILTCSFLCFGCSAEICENNCPFSNDLVCDDGGADSFSDQCEYGRDCNDCGARPRKR